MRPLVCSLFLALAALPPATARADGTIAAGRMGEVAWLAPDGEPSGVVFLFSDTNGQVADLDAAASRLRSLGAAVLKVDTKAYLAALDAKGTGDCLYLLSEIEDASHRLQAELGTARYHAPILAGTGAGAALAYAALAQAPAATLSGAASDGFTTRLATRLPLCPGAATTKASGGFAYAAKADPPGWWRVLPWAGQTEAARAFAATIDQAELVEGPLADQADPAGRFERLLLEPLIGPEPPAAMLDDLPLVELPAEGPGDLLAIVWSGDGGWRDLDKTIGERLQARGVAVVGVDSLRYFWQEHKPGAIAADLGAVIDHYTAAWDRPRVLLIGYSFGADVLPAAINRLSDDRRARVVRVALLGFSRNADFEIHVAGWLTSTVSDDAEPTLPEVARLDPARLQCFYGAEESDTACTDPAFDKAERIETKGGHHFDGDYGALADRILKGLDGR